MDFDIDYIAHNNKISDSSAYVKVFVSLILILSTLAFSNDYYSIAIIILSSILVLGIARISIKNYFKFLTIPFAFTFLTCIFLLLFFPQGEYIWNSGILGIGITTYSYITSKTIFFRVFGCFSALGFMTLTTPIADIMHVLRRCYVPKVFCEIATLMYNAIFIFLERFETMRNAQKSRLGDLTTRKNTIKSLGGISANIFLTSLEKSESLQRSLDSRSYVGEIPIYKPDRSKDSYPVLVK